MAGPDLHRINKELRDLQAPATWDTAGVKAEPIGGDLTKMRGWIKGPEDSVYEGGVFELAITIPKTYPFDPLIMKFVTQVWHPNISSVTGVICLDILKPSSWSPALTIKTTLLSIRALLVAPEPKDPQDAVVAEQYMKRRAEFDSQARFWTESFAMKDKDAGAAATGGAGAAEAGSAAAAAPLPAGLDASSLEQLTSMGFPRDKSIAALVAKKGNVEQAIEYLFTN